VQNYPKKERAAEIYKYKLREILTWGAEGEGSMFTDSEPPPAPTIIVGTPFSCRTGKGANPSDLMGCLKFVLL
jgi:hypothetical protein